ncbi:MAG TPA: 2-amino-4-hydroxy-6-hydroxymethyldihydropteridine diphosphokinase [Thermodesulfatator atlanticus]|uniref:2-amino-4-hydroxy-6-hydroxymethyldihydropteridine pyrophosphokinase n=1 Tax=Thermodesulfatator atlanticus TaxID=501497 RepID=A0A7V5NZZ5_9BACT|nr:2-amino-4-hydroxy-6-hydroxymethyldihydropteridine diphosphokinase [Thermodesulfatator atlanticus]
MGIGSNLGERRAFCVRALRALAKTPGVTLRRWSKIYLTPPVGFASKNYFYNLVCEVETALSPQALLFRLWQIELSCGRLRRGRLADRTLDLDLLLYDDLILRDASLTLPHPRLHLRGFVLFPLVELIPEEKHPMLNKSFVSLLADLSPEEKGEIKAIGELCV